MTQPLTDPIKAFNSDVRKWANRVGSGLIGNIMAFATKGKGTLSAGLKTRTRTDYGEIDRITYHFPRHGVFLQKGVGRGYMMKGRTVVRGIKSGKTPRIINAPMQRAPEDWFNGTIQKEAPELANIVANHYSDRVVSDVDRILIR